MSVVNIGLHHVCKVCKIIFIMFSRCLERDSLGSKYALNRPLIIHGKSYSLFLVSFIIIGTICPLKFTLNSGSVYCTTMKKSVKCWQNNMYISLV